MDPDFFFFFFFFFFLFLTDNIIMLWVVIRSASCEYQQHMFLKRTRKVKKQCLILVLLNKLRCHTHFYFQQIRLLDPHCCSKFTYLMAKSADPDQLASKPTDLDLHCLPRQGLSRLSRTRVKRHPSKDRNVSERQEDVFRTIYPPPHNCWGCKQ